MTIHPPNIGPYYEDFNVGDIIKHWPGRTVTETDNTWFTLLTLNTHPIHFDVNYAKDQMFGKPIVNSTFTLALLAGMTVRDTSQNTIANLGWGGYQNPQAGFCRGYHLRRNGGHGKTTVQVQAGNRNCQV